MLRTILYSCWLYSMTSMGSVRFGRFAERSSFPCAVSSPAGAPQQAACFTRIAATGRPRSERARRTEPEGGVEMRAARRHEGALEGSGWGINQWSTVSRCLAIFGMSFFFFLFDSTFRLAYVCVAGQLRPSVTRSLHYLQAHSRTHRCSCSVVSPV